ncbi:hypothetical protein DOTSEDRAFT_20845 [Dothistroma septosporum NZE10]|uniref:Uncharacterized protein n=1 Tax=Dothistroma septosporum (strain NZE10 / CBS 128990) TaxID=675120 RepID=N1PX78_DOTSN|nr:hypothetical protein DOTSEDRAFT_20845 [Dothistroma septosporum NZE10]
MHISTVIAPFLMALACASLAVGQENGALTGNIAKRDEDGLPIHVAAEERDAAPETPFVKRAYKDFYIEYDDDTNGK